MRASPTGTWQPERVFPPAAEAFAELRRRRRRPKSPTVTFVTAGGTFDPTHPALERGAIVLTTRSAAARLKKSVPVASEVVAVNDGDQVDLQQALTCLRARGHSMILSEGGPTLFASLLASDLVRELFLTISPLLAGRAAHSRLPLVKGIELLPDATAILRLHSVRRHENHLFLRYNFSPQQPSQSRTRRRTLSANRARSSMLGLPEGVRACLFDLDGVLTQTAKVHAAAWKEMFDGFLREFATTRGLPFRPFDPVADYDQYVDGKPRSDGVRSFLAARGIDLPEGKEDDSPAQETVHGLGSRKNEIVLGLIRAEGVEPYEGSVRYVRAAKKAGLRRAVVSSSTNCREVLASAGMEDLFEQRIDGLVVERDHLKGKPSPDTFLAGARALGVEPGQAAVFEDALAGVAAGRAGGFACVVGVDRVGQADELRAHGADVVVRDLAELLDL